MLNLRSAYYKDQLCEKLQLMLATQELEVTSWSKCHPTKETWHFYLRNTDERHRVDLETTTYKDLDRAIASLAERLINKLVQQEILNNPAVFIEGAQSQ